MKLLFIFASSAISIFPFSSATVRAEKSIAVHIGTIAPVPARESNNILSLRDQGGLSKMAVAEFKDKQFCRSESGDFNFDAKSSLIGAKVYFYGKGFHAVAKGMLTGNSLQPVAELVKLCKAGTIVAFDEIKVLGAYNQIQTIKGVSYLLY